MRLQNSPFVACLLCALGGAQIEARHYVLVRRIYAAGEEGQAMLKKDESSRFLGWPSGVSSEVALMDSAPILRAVVEKDEDSNEVDSSIADVYRSTGLSQGRSAPRRIENHSSEKNDTIVSGSDGRADVKDNESKKNDKHNLEPQTADSERRINSTRSSLERQESKADTNSQRESSDAEVTHEDDRDMDSIDISSIEKIMSRQRIRVMGPRHPMAPVHLDRAEDVQYISNPESLETFATAAATQSQASERTNVSTKIPDQVMRIAEWLLNRTP